ncbi:MAG: cbb3-type cytochrome c oxidase N-terminal domain-containing protein [Bacteroidia bacterium]
MNKKLMLTAGIGLLSLMVQAQETESAIGFGQVMLIINIVLLVVALILINLLSYSIKQIKQGVKPGQVYISWWERFAALKSEKTEEELDLHEDYDGIRELDNPTPPWFNFIFYTTIIFAVIYLINYHVIGYSSLQEKEYDEEVAEAKIAKENYLKKVGNLIDENSVTYLTDNATIDEGKKVYMQNCKVCHGEFGEGLVGPNLTDDYWLHGNTINDIFKTIKYGVPQKGMVAWQNSLTPVQIQQVSSFILTLKGTNPANAKEPQGVKVESNDATADTTANNAIALK